MDFIIAIQEPSERIIGHISAFLKDIFNKSDDVVTQIVVHPSTPVYTPKSVFELSPLKIIIFIIIFILAIGIIYAYIRLDELEKQDAERMGKYFIRPTPEKRTNDRWEKVSLLFQSPNEADWRMGIMEADVILDELTRALGYKGETLGDRMKQIEPSDFPTLQLAWQAHLVRNKIAHEGMNYNLTHQEAWHVYKLFETVFRDARFI